MLRRQSAHGTYSPTHLASPVLWALGALLTIAPLVAADSVPELLLAESRVTDDTIAHYKRLSLEQLMDLEVTSVSRQPESYKNAAAALVVVTGEDVRRSAASSIPEALRLADNLQVGQLTSSGWNISARGFNSATANKLLVLMDGRSIYTPLFSGVIWNNQDYLLEDLDRIEVVSGPGGTLWGANAVNGVINIVSKSAKDTQGFFGEVGGGSWLHDFVGLRYGGTLASNVYFRVYGKYFDRGSEVFRDGSSAKDGWNRGQGGFRVDAEPSDQNHFMFEGGGYGGNNDALPGGQGMPSATGHSSGGHVLGRWTHTFSEDSDMSLQLYYDRTHLEAPFQSAGTIPAGTLVDDLDTYDLDFQHRFGLGERHRIVWGLGYRHTHDEVQQAPLFAFLPGELDQDLYSGFLQDEIRLHERLYFTIGSKIEHYDYTGWEYEPNARLRWQFTDNQMLWAAVSRAVRTPARFDRDLFNPHPTFGTFITGNNTFDSEWVIAYELGYRAVITPKLSSAISGFYNDYHDLRSLSPTPTFTLPFTYKNDLHAETYGFELSADYQCLSWWRLHAGYTLLKENIGIGPGGDISQGLSETADPQHQVFVRSSMDLPGNLEFDAAFRWIDTVHNSAGPTPGKVPAYAELDLRLAWRCTKNIELSVVGQNLFDTQNPEAGFPGPDQEEIVRSVYGKITVRF